MERDRALLQRFREGVPDAMGEVYRQYAGPLTRMLRAAAYRGRGFAILRSQVELENAVLEVFARAFEPRARLVYDGIRPYEHFLMGIARNYLLEVSRSREHAAGLAPPADEVELSLEHGQDLHQVYEDREVDALLESFRASLTDEEKGIYAARFADGLAQEAAAEKLGLTRIQLRRREFAIKKRLLEWLKAKGYLRDLAVSGWSFVKKQVQS
jgi:DNA-directed RNA polymerase specialized sigma24 family protein